MLQTLPATLKWCWDVSRGLVQESPAEEDCSGSVVVDVDVWLCCCIACWRPDNWKGVLQFAVSTSCACLCTAAAFETLAHALCVVCLCTKLGCLYVAVGRMIKPRA